MTFMMEADDYVDNRPRHNDGTLKVFCSFCGKDDHEVKSMIQGPNVAICCDCVDICVELINESQPNYAFP